MNDNHTNTSQNRDSSGTSGSATGRCGPADVEAGDEVVFTYGPKDRKSWKDATEVLDWGVRVNGGGIVPYRDIIQINPSGDRNACSVDTDISHSEGQR